MAPSGAQNLSINQRWAVDPGPHPTLSDFQGLSPLSTCPAQCKHGQPNGESHDADAPPPSVFDPARLQFLLYHGPSPSTMMRRHLSVRRWLGRRHSVVLIALLALFALIRSLPALKNNLDSRVGAVLSEDRPRYLYQSSFRKNPDWIYEEQLSNALQVIERQQLALNSDEDKTHTLWQIMLGQDSSAAIRGEDSLEFEKKNFEWKYSVRLRESMEYDVRDCAIGRRVAN